MRHVRLVCTVAMAACASNGTPAPQPADPIAQFDTYWSAFDATYPAFALKGVDWNAQRAQYRGRAASAVGTPAVVEVLREMAAALNDGHVTFTRPNGTVIRTWNPVATINVDVARRNASLDGAPIIQAKPNLAYASLAGDIGYVAFGGWNPSQFSAADADAVLDRFRTARGLIIDVRMNGGGDDRLAFAVAGRFLTAARSAGTVRYRNGAAHTQLGLPTLVSVAPRGERITVPVIVLTGRGVYSSCESVVEAIKQEALVTTVGDTTGGSSGNPEQRNLADGWTFTVPRWLHTGIDGQPIEGRGIAPEVHASWSSGGTPPGRDEVLDAAVARLRGGR